MCPWGGMGVFVLLALACLAGISAASDWHQFQKDETNAGVTHDSAPTSDSKLAWNMQTDGINVPPIVAGNLVYVYDANGTIHVIDRKNGSLV